VAVSALYRIVYRDRHENEVAGLWYRPWRATLNAVARAMRSHRRHGQFRPVRVERAP
jgi:hypothetical protein